MKRTLICLSVLLFTFTQHPAIANTCDQHLGQAQEFNDKARQLNADWKQIVKELKAGLFCSMCKRSRTEIERTGEPFKQHLKSVNGEAIPMTKAQFARKRQQFEQELAKIERRYGNAQRSYDSCRVAEQRRQIVSNYNDLHGHMRDRANANNTKIQQQLEKSRRQAGAHRNEADRWRQEQDRVSSELQAYGQQPRDMEAPARLSPGQVNQLRSIESRVGNVAAEISEPQLDLGVDMKEIYDLVGDESLAALQGGLSMKGAQADAWYVGKVRNILTWTDFVDKLDTASKEGASFGDKLDGIGSVVNQTASLLLGRWSTPVTTAASGLIDGTKHSLGLLDRAFEANAEDAHRILEMDESEILIHYVPFGKQAVKLRDLFRGNER